MTTIFTEKRELDISYFMMYIYLYIYIKKYLILKDWRKLTDQQMSL